MNDDDIPFDDKSTPEQREALKLEHLKALESVTALTIGNVDHGELELSVELGSRKGSVWISQAFWQQMGEKPGWLAFERMVPVLEEEHAAFEAEEEELFELISNDQLKGLPEVVEATAARALDPEHRRVVNYFAGRGIATPAEGQNFGVDPAKVAHVLELEGWERRRHGPADDPNERPYYLEPDHPMTSLRSSWAQLEETIHDRWREQSWSFEQACAWVRLALAVNEVEARELVSSIGYPAPTAEQQAKVREALRRQRARIQVSYGDAHDD